MRNLLYDFIRILLAIQVFMTHFFQYAYQRLDSDNYFLQILLNNNLSIKLFFLFSGFFVYKYTPMIRRNIKQLFYFQLKRYLRLIIPLFFSFAIYLIYRQNFTLTDLFIYSLYKGFEKEIALNPALWTLKAEIIGHAVLSLFIFLYYINNVTRFIGFLLSAICIVLLPYTVFHFLGCIIALISKKDHISLSAFQKISLLVISIYLVGYSGDLALYPSTQPLLLYHLFTGLGIVMLFYLIISLDVKLYSKNFMAFLTQLYYPVYIFHFPVILTFSKPLYIQNMYLNFLITTLIVFLIAAIFYVLFERRLNGYLKRKLT